MPEASETPGKKPGKISGLLKSKLLIYIGAFFLSYLVICVIMFFLLKGKFAGAPAETAPADSTALAQMDSSAVDSTTIPADTLALAADTSAQKYSLGLAILDSLKIPSAAPAETTAAVPETLFASIPDTTVDTSIIAMMGKKPAEVDTAALAEYRKRITKLVKIVDKMKPIDTVSIFSKLDDELVLQLLIRMKDRNAAKVLSQMPPSRAARLSAKLGSQTSG